MYKQLTSPLSSSPFYSLSLPVVTQIRGHISGSSSPLPTTVRALHFISRRFQLSLVDSRRIVLSHARRSQQLILLIFSANKFKISPRRDSNSRTNTSSIRGLPLVHRGDLFLYDTNSCIDMLAISSRRSRSQVQTMFRAVNAIRSSR